MFGIMRSRSRWASSNCEEYPDHLPRALRIRQCVANGCKCECHKAPSKDWSNTKLLAYMGVFGVFWFGFWMLVSYLMRHGPH
jgi:hypothetical protein